MSGSFASLQTRENYIDLANRKWDCNRWRN